MNRKEAKDLLDNLIGFIEDNHGSDYDEALKIAIKALEQEPCEDAISRQAVLDAMFELCDTGETLKENPWRDNPHIDAITDAINDLPSVNPQESKWIPVSERLPEEHKDVLTCGLGGFIEIQSFENAYDGYWENQNGTWSDLDEVAAWMPLPPSYQGEENG